MKCAEMTRGPFKGRPSDRLEWRPAASLKGCSLRRQDHDCAMRKDMAVALAAGLSMKTVAAQSQLQT